MVVVRPLERVVSVAAIDMLCQRCHWCVLYMPRTKEVMPNEKLKYKAKYSYFQYQTENAAYVLIIIPFRGITACPQKRV